MKKSDSELATMIKVGGIYSYYKNLDNKYKVLGLAILESNTEVCVIYEPQYGVKLPFVRPLSNWLEEVEINNTNFKRFTLVNSQ